MGKFVAVTSVVVTSVLGTSGLRERRHALVMSALGMSAWEMAVVESHFWRRFILERHDGVRANGATCLRHPDLGYLEGSQAWAHF